MWIKYNDGLLFLWVPYFHSKWRLLYVVVARSPSMICFSALRKSREVNMTAPNTSCCECSKNMKAICKTYCRLIDSVNWNIFYYYWKSWLNMCPHKNYTLKLRLDIRMLHAKRDIYHLYGPSKAAIQTSPLPLSSCRTAAEMTWSSEGSPQANVSSFNSFNRSGQ